MATIFQWLFPELREKRTSMRWKPCAEEAGNMAAHSWCPRACGESESWGTLCPGSWSFSKRLEQHLGDGGRSWH